MGSGLEQNIIIYNTSDGKAKVALYARDGSVWMNQNQIAELFDTSKPITMKVSDLSGTLLLTVVDVFNSYTNLDELVGPGSYNIYFYDGATGALLEPAGDQEMHVIDIK